MTSMQSDPQPESQSAEDSECVIPGNTLPPEEIARYSPQRDPDLERDIAQYVEGQAPDETVQHVEMIKAEFVMGERYEVWDVVTDKDRWWVITNAVNLYSQKHFPSLDYTISFHIGLMMRIRSRRDSDDQEEHSRLAEIFRRQEQAMQRHFSAVEPEEFQAIGMQLRESLISFIDAVREDIEFPVELDQPKAADFVNWSDLILNHLCSGSSNKQLRQYLKKMATETWQLVNWLTHHRNANRAATTIALHACDTLFGHFVQVMARDKSDIVKQCPVCSSRNIRRHYDPDIEPDGDYYNTCGVCRWSNHPDAGEGEADPPPYEGDHI